METVSQLCGVSLGVFQWVGGGIVVALLLAGFGLGVRQGYRMGRKAQRDLEAVGRSSGPVPLVAQPLVPRGQWRCEVCGGWTNIVPPRQYVSEACATCGNPRGTPGFHGPPPSRPPAA